MTIRARAGFSRGVPGRGRTHNNIALLERPILIRCHYPAKTAPQKVDAALDSAGTGQRSYGAKLLRSWRNAP